VAAAALGPVASAGAQYEEEGQQQQQQQQDRPTTTAPEPAQDDDGDGDGGGPPIWAGIGLIGLAAVAGTMAARARNRRRMRDYTGN
jgi:hypothetical protein